MVILSNKAVTIAEISDILTIPKRTVEREIKNLRESGKITRRGGRRYGYWEIM
jgi:ATP-dependent DNA helicase RecG